MLTFKSKQTNSSDNTCADHFIAFKVLLNTSFTDLVKCLGRCCYLHFTDSKTEIYNLGTVHFLKS